MTEKREHWGSRVGFILAAAGSAVGLGNIWKFPYIAGENGGAAFVFVYLICIAVVGLPVLIAEILMGRTTQRNPVGAFIKLSGSRFWTAVGGMGIVAGFVILSF
ncbi:MAG: sodium-dependent transporter, partial [Fidelibacterota bacterium]